MTVVNYTKQNTLTLREGVDFKYRFLPGANEVPQETWDMLSKNESCQLLLGKRVLEVVTVKVPGAIPPVASSGLKRVGEEPKPKDVDSELDSLKEADIGVMDAWSAISLVESVIDLSHLRRYLEQENQRKGQARVTVLKALNAQIKAMEITEPGGKAS